MKLIAELTGGYGNESTRVRIGYMPSRKYNGFGESEGLNYDDWGWVASTKLCSTEDLDCSGQGKSLPEALADLAKNMTNKWTEIHNRWVDRERSAVEKYKAFQKRFQG